MLKSNTKSKSGFTIIEVVLVLAIAGLIFLMVFIALPALRRSQKDTQRKDDVSRLQTALNNYQSNNRGALPGGTETYDPKNPTGASNPWETFYQRYLVVEESSNGKDVFEDPDGTAYALSVVDCGATGAECSNEAQAPNTWSEQAKPTVSSTPPYAIKVVLGATCDGEKAVLSTGARKVAMLYKLEGGGVVCVNN